MPFPPLQVGPNLDNLVRVTTFYCHRDKKILQSTLRKTQLSLTKSNVSSKLIWLFWFSKRLFNDRCPQNCATVANNKKQNCTTRNRAGMKRSQICQGPQIGLFGCLQSRVAEKSFLFRSPPICIHLYYANNKSCFLGKTRSKECSNKNVEKIEEYDVIGGIGGVGVIDGG